MDGKEDYDVIHIHDDIDEDIKLLKNVLQDDDANKEVESDGELQIIEQNEDEYVSLHSASRPSTSTDYTASSFPTTSMGTDADDLAYRIEHSSITPETCLAMNRAYQEVLLDTLRSVELSLTENRLKQKQMTDILEQKSKKPLKNASKTREFVLKSPFFVDKGDIPPLNADVVQKQQMGDDMFPIRRRTGWTRRVRKDLLKAIGEDALKHLLRPILNRLEVESAKMKDCKNDQEIKEHTAKIAELKRELLVKQQTPPEELLENVDSDKIDFLKISCVAFDGRMSPGECEGFWRNVLHPSINREDWTDQEEENLAVIAKKFNMKLWDKIASELGTNRTAFQCLQHYQLKSLVYDQSEWRPEEDELLLEVVDTVKYGTGKIQWSQVSYFIEKRSASQCLNRWRRINPNSKRGRWANKEDCLLISAVEKYGVNSWTRIASLVPGRSSVQCRDRYMNCILTGQHCWTYEEDKKLLQLYHQHQNYAAVSLYMDKRTEIDVEKRYLQLKLWEDRWNHFCTLDRKEQEEQMSCNFKLTKDGTLVAFEYLSSWAEQEKDLGKPKVVVDAEWRELYKFFEDHEVLRGMEADTWKWMETNYQIKTSDYFKQEQDRIRDDIIVPRPPPIRDQKVYGIYLTEKNKLKRLIENHIDSTVNRFYTQENKNNQTLIDSMSLTMRELFEENEKKKYVEEKTMEIIKKGGKKLFSHKLTVKMILDILRDNRPAKTLKEKMKDVANKKKQGNVKHIKKEIWEESSEEESSDAKSDDSEDEDEEDDEDDLIEEEQVIKPKRTFTPAQIERYKKFQDARRNHKYAMDMIRDVIISKLPSHTVGRKRVFNMYPQHVRDKCKQLGEEDLESEKHKCLGLLMRSFDVDTKTVFKNAKEAKRKHAAHALLMSAVPLGKTRRSRNKSLQGVNSEVMEHADILQEIQKNLEGENDEEKHEDENNKQNVKVEPEVGVSEKDDNGGNDNGPNVKPIIDLYESYDTCLPYIPPNVTTVSGLKGFLLQHKCLVDKAGGYFNKEELRDKLYKMKKRGPNLLMNVIGTVRGPILDKLCVKKKPTLTDEQMKKTFNAIAQTKPYQQLKARFQAAFSWPALLATIPPPRDGINVPDSLLKIRKVVEVDRVTNLEANFEESNVVQENDVGENQGDQLNGTETSEQKSVKRGRGRKPKSKKGSSLDTGTKDPSLDEEPGEEEEFELVPSPEPKSEAELQREEDWNIDDSIKQVLLMTQGQLISEEMEEIEINMLVDRILRVFRERRMTKKRPKSFPGKYRKKMSEAMAAAVDLREKIKIMKRLNIYERYKKIQEEKKELVGKMEIPEPVDPNAPKKRGRPFGAKSTCYSAPDENTRRSSRQELLRAKAQQMEVYEECGASPKRRPRVAPNQFEDDYVYTRDEFKEYQKITEKNRRAMEYGSKDPKKLTVAKVVANAKKTNDVVYIKQEPLLDITEQLEVEGQQKLNQTDHSNVSNQSQNSMNDSPALESVTQQENAENVQMVSTATNGDIVPTSTKSNDAVAIATKIKIASKTTKDKTVTTATTTTNINAVSTSTNTVSDETKRKLASKATKGRMVSTATSTKSEEVYIATKKQSSGYTLVPIRSARSTHFRLVPTDQLKKAENKKQIVSKSKGSQSSVAESRGKKRPAIKTPDEDHSKSKKPMIIDRPVSERLTPAAQGAGKLISVSEKVISVKKAPDIQVSDKTISDKAISEKFIIVKKAPGIQVSDKTISDKTVSEKIVSVKNVSDIEIPDKPISDETDLKKVGPDKSVPDKTVSGKSVSDKPVLDKVVSDKQVSDKLSLGKTIPEKTILGKLIPESPSKVSQPKSIEKKANQKSGGKKRVTKSPAIKKLTKSSKGKEVSHGENSLVNTAGQHLPQDTPSIIQDVSKTANADLTEQIPETSQEYTSTNQSFIPRVGQDTELVQNEMNTQMNTIEVCPNDSASQVSVNSENNAVVTDQGNKNGDNTLAQCSGTDVNENNSEKSTSMQSVETENQTQISENSKTNKPCQAGNQTNTSNSKSLKRKLVTESPKGTSASARPKRRSVLQTPKSSSITESPKSKSTTKSLKNSSMSKSPKNSPITKSQKSGSITKNRQSASNAKSPRSRSITKSPKSSSITSPKSSSVTKSPKSSSVTMSGDAGDQAASGSNTDKMQNKDPVMIGVPIMVDGVQQTAWLPIFPGKDGQLMRDKDGNIVIPKEVAQIRFPGDGSSQ